MVDLLIKNGTVVDGSGGSAFLSDIAVHNGRIEKIGPSLKMDCETLLDASGKIVCPGFIDIHSHTDATILINPKAESKIRQGVTTEIVGNCGMSAAPITIEFLPEVKDHLTVNSDFGNAEDIGKHWVSFGEYVQYLNELPPGINLMPLVGYGTLRSAVMGLKSGPPTQNEMKAMEDLLEKSLEEGAAGLSTGLEYIPDALCHPDELIRLARVIKRHDKLYASHIRGEAQTLFPAIEEAIRTGEESGCKTEISHLKLGGKFNWGKTDQLFAILEKALSRGVRLSWDQYPYIAWGTGLVDYIPNWVQQEGHQKLIEYLTSTSTRKKIRQEIESAIKTGNHAYNTAPWENLQIVMAKSPDYQFTEGKRVSEIAQEKDIDPIDFIFDLLIAEKGSVKTLVFCMDEEDIKTIMSHPKTIIASDGRAVATYGELNKGSTHPRYYGAFPRILGKYVRDEKVLTMETAIQKMTSMPAEIMGLKDRGTLAPNMIADITVFDPETVSDMATYKNSHQYPQGIEVVLIAGDIIINQGVHSNHMAGKIL
jgi:N-acyl-D-aspartate/D-glutamate deacylase